MARKSLEEKLAAVGALEREDAAALIPWLADASNVVVARAAEGLARHGVLAAMPALREALVRLLRAPRPAEADKLCRAKEALVLALDALGNPEGDPYRLGMRHVQMEPVYLRTLADVAPVLRAHCITALARLREADVEFDLLPLLFDPEPQPRLAAVRALAYLGGARNEQVLRVLVLRGGLEPELLAACFAGLLAMEPERSLSFVAGYLAGERDYAEQAALALGESRLPAAYAALREAWEANTDLALRGPLLLALALTHHDDAFACLLDIMRDGDVTTALLACDALALYGADSRLRERAEAVVAKRRNPKLTDRYLDHFPLAP
jgi:hypothetical protein